MHISPLLLGVAQLTLATTSVTAVALPRARSRRAHAANFLKLRTPPSSAERFVAPAEPVVVAEKREVIPADVYHRPTGADGSSSSLSASSASESTVPVSTDSITTSSGKNTQQPDLGLSDSEASSVVGSLIASVSVYETFTYSAYSAQATPSSSLASSSSSTAATESAVVDPIQQAKQAAASYALGQNGAVNMPTVTVHLVMEPTQEADGSWDYVVKLGADGTPTASPTWVAATATSTVFPTATLINEESASASEYYVPEVSSIGGQVSAPISTPAAQDSGEYYYGNTHTYNSTTYGSGSSSPLAALDTTVRTLLSTTSSHAAFECATTTAYYYSEDSDGIQSCPGGTVCRFVDTACSPCVWPDQDIWCNGNIYPWITATPSLPETIVVPTSTATTQDSQITQPAVTSVISTFSSEITAAPTSAPESTYVTGSGFVSASGETGRSAVTFTYTPSATVGPITATEQPTTSPYFYGSGYASASGETGRSAITFTYTSSSVAASETISPSAAESTAWTSGHGQQHSYPWMTASVTESGAAPTAAPTEIASSESASVTLSTTLSNGAVIVTVAPTQSTQASTTVNSWLVEATKGFDPVQGQPSSSVTSSSAAIPTEVASSVMESGSATVSSFYPSISASESAISASISSSAESAYVTNPASTYASELPWNATSAVATPTSAGESATVTASQTSATQSANEESASVVSSTAAWASSSSGTFPSSQIASDASVLPTASATFQSSVPVITATASASTTEDPTDNGIATETVTDWDIVNATSTTYVPYGTASVTSASPSITAGLNASTSDFVITDTINSTLTASQTASAEATSAYTSPILHQWPANVTDTIVTSAPSSTDSAWESAITSQVSSTESAWESAITSQASSTDAQASQSATSSDASSSESVSTTATATSSAAESTETGSDEDECEEWEEVWVDERDIQDDWIIVE
ncbi:hypothetical protein QFC24_002809 [Naganishia onofrii]|uniref:Uncharacterized protein n=1 Tax=Naganishia onofrii TaxID=1851511 RepID=A0ACC2XMN2_9TREE|nr:hypothetical protein QFC24_002809 [Naganishia onofrii]